MQKLLLKAHAGCENTIPNSREYLIQAYKSRADIIEIDVQRTADGVLLALHDDYVADLAVSMTDYERLRRSMPGLLTLRQALLLLSDYSGLINLDFKSNLIFQEAADLIREMGLLPRVILSGIQEQDTKECFRIFGKVRIWLSTPYRPKGVPERERAGYQNACLRMLQETDCTELNIYIQDCWPELIETLHQKGMQVHVWTVDEPADMQKMIEAKADSITTNYPARLRRLLEQQERSAPAQAGTP